MLRKEDWWAIWISVGLIIVAIGLMASGSSIKWLAVAPQKWTHLSEAVAQFGTHAPQYAALFAVWAVLFGIATSALGYRWTYFLPAFLITPRIGGIRLFQWLVLLLVVPLCYRLTNLLGPLFRPLVAAWRRRRSSVVSTPPRLVANRASRTPATKRSAAAASGRTSEMMAPNPG